MKRPEKDPAVQAILNDEAFIASIFELAKRPEPIQATRQGRRRYALAQQIAELDGSLRGLPIDEQGSRLEKIGDLYDEYVLLCYPDLDRQRRSRACVMRP